jgi:hypothetical protein
MDPIFRTFAVRLDLRDSVLPKLLNRETLNKLRSEISQHTNQFFLEKEKLDSFERENFDSFCDTLNFLGDILVCRDTQFGNHWFSPSFMFIDLLFLVGCFIDLLYSSSRKHKILPKSINEHKFSLLSFMFLFTLTLPILINILKTDIYI